VVLREIAREKADRPARGWNSTREGNSERLARLRIIIRISFGISRTAFPECPSHETHVRSPINSNANKWKRVATLFLFPHETQADRMGELSSPVGLVDGVSNCPSDSGGVAAARAKRARRTRGERRVAALPKSPTFLETLTALTPPSPSAGLIARILIART